MRDGIDSIGKYVNRRLNQFVASGIIDKEARDEQYTKGYFYLQRVGLTGGNI